MQADFGATRIVLHRGDITEETVDAIVNAANSRLIGGGGVDGAIHRAGGPEIMSECDAIRASQGGCPTGDAVLTSAGHLPAKHVIHAVGPVWGEARAEECDALLAGAYRNSLRLASEQGLRSIAFPSISTGAYGFPIERAASLALATIRDCVTGSKIAEVRFVLFSKEDFKIYEESLRKIPLPE